MGGTSSKPTTSSTTSSTASNLQSLKMGNLNQSCNSNKRCNNNTLVCNENNICKLGNNINCIDSFDCISNLENSCSYDSKSAVKLCHFSQEIDKSLDIKEKFISTKKKLIFELK